jgi:ParB family chromosome partitioning protein
MKKGDMATEAERLLADTGWLPEPLRMVDSDAEPDTMTSGDVEADDLPEFLVGDGEDEESTDEEDEAQNMVAAE